MARGVRRVAPGAEIILQPLADGGEGTLELLRRVLGLQRRRVRVPGPLREPVLASYLLGGDGRAFIEIAEACGLHLIPAHRRNPCNTTTIGVGVLIDDALARGARNISLLLGGSGTSDCGAGMAGALGYSFLRDRETDYIPMADTLEYVIRIGREEVTPGLTAARFTAVCDVDNPLLGPNGATYTYAAQKGAPPDRLPDLERNMMSFANRLETWLGVDVRNLPGAGAAGGLGAGAVAFLGADIRSGIDMVLDAVGFDEHIRGCQLVLTGEGKIDAQTLRGKVVGGVGRRVEQLRGGGKARQPVVLAFAGMDALTKTASIPGVDGRAALLDNPAYGADYAMAHAGDLLADLVAGALRKSGLVTPD